MLGAVISSARREVPAGDRTPPQLSFLTEPPVQPSLGTGFVVHDLHPRVRADHEHFSTMHDAGMDEDSFACGDFAKAEAFIDKPLVDD